MNKIFANLLDICVVIHLDNILIYSDNLENHKGYIKEVLYHLRTNSLYASLAKCLFYKDKVKFLGFILGPEGIQIDEKKVYIIKAWPTLCKIKNIQVFLGFANFYKRFVHGYFKRSLPLT